MTALVAVILALPAADRARALDVPAARQEAMSPTLPPKSGRTPAQQKINGQLLQEIERARKTPRGPYTSGSGVKVDSQRRAKVDVRVAVTPAIEKAITSLGSTIVGTSPAYRSVVAWVPLLEIETLAADPTVVAIVPSRDPELR
jgi:hypothetical protein